MESKSALQTDQSPRVEDGDFQTGKILVLSIAHFVHDVYSSFLAPLLPLLIEKLSMSLTQAGFLSSVMQIPALLNPYIGVLADRISVRYFVILAPAMTAVPMSLIGMAPGYGVLLILLFITGISVSVFHVPSPVMVADLSAARKGRGMSFFMTGGELARTIGPLVAVAGLVWWPYRRREVDQTGVLFGSSVGRRTAGLAAFIGLIVTPLLIIADEMWLQTTTWAPSVFSHGLLPFLVLAAAVVGFRMILRKKLDATREDADQAVFVLMGVAFAVLTITGVWFRGAGMALVWPW